MKRCFTSGAERRGFALLTVMAVVAGSVTLGLLISREAQGVISTASNRKAYTIARWRAADCVERARAVLDYEDETVASTRSVWPQLDVFIQQTAVVTQAQGCDLSAQALGDQVDVNTVAPSALRRLLEALNLSASTVDTLVDAILDWRDDDSEPRTFGAEVDWYAANGRVAPRNGAIRSSLELALVRGFEKRQDIIHYFGTQQSRASLAHSPRAVLLSLPGFSVELAEEILRRRSLGSVPSDVLHLAGVLSEGARDSLMSQQGSLAGRIAMEPDGWVFTSRGRVAGSEVTCVLEVTVTRSGSGTQITRRREWWE